MNWFKKLLPSKIRTEADKKKGVPEGLWSKCSACQAVLFRAELERNLFVCPKCNHHRRINARTRLQQLFDEESWEEIAAEVGAVDRLKFRDSKKYKDRIAAAKKKSNAEEALLVGDGKVHDVPLVAAAFEYGFIGGSMGTAVGERFVRGAHVALEKQIPLISFSASGGARMQEGLFSLFQMAKTSAAIAKLRAANLPFFSILTDPTTGGVSASLAMLGDIIIAEPKSLIGFTGPRVIEQTVREKLPKGFQRSEFLLEHGAIDMIVDRRELRDKVAGLLAKLLHRQGK